MLLYADILKHFYFYKSNVFIKNFIIFLTKQKDSKLEYKIKVKFIYHSKSSRGKLFWKLYDKGTFIENH